MTAPQVDKKGLRDYLLSISEQQGVEVARKELLQFLKDSGKELREYSQDLFFEFRGELGEILLEMYLIQYVRKNPNSFYVKGLCVEKGVKGGFSDYTELDVTLFTEGQVVLFECKCYGGEKALTDECTIQRVGREPMDVHGQSLAHLKQLTYHIDTYRDKSKKFKYTPYKIALFELSMDITNDNRSDENKKRLPYLTESNIERFLTSLPNQRAFSMQKVFDKITELDKYSAENFDKHIKQLKESKS